MIEKINEDYCSYKVSKLLNEKGFEIDTNKDYWKIGEDGTRYFMSSIGAYTSDPYITSAFYRPKNSYPCPTHQMALKWLRDVHNINIEINFNRYGPNYRYKIIYKPEILDDIYSTGNYLYYEDAVEAALQEALETIV